MIQITYRGSLSSDASILQAFRPGVVDMTEDQLAVNQNAITLQGNQLDLDALLPDINWYVTPCVPCAL